MIFTKRVPRTSVLSLILWHKNKLEIIYSILALNNLYVVV